MNRHVFANVLTNATVEAQTMRIPSRYKAVYVLLLSWADDKTGVYEAVDGLQEVFRDLYHFRTEKWTIPQHDSSVLLSQKLAAFRERPQEEDMPNPSEVADGMKPPLNEDFLRIVYYAGRSHIKRGDECYWFWSVNLYGT